LHEQLYQSGNLSVIPATNYLTDPLSELRNFWEADSAQPHCDIVADNISLTTNGHA